MNNFNKFLSFCIPTRILLVALAFIVGNKYKSYSKILALLSILAALFFVINEYRGKKGAFGSERYWSGKIHALLYTLFAITLLVSPKYAWILLVVDLIYGINTVLKHYK